MLSVGGVISETSTLTFFVLVEVVVVFGASVVVVVAGVVSIVVAFVIVVVVVVFVVSVVTTVVSGIGSGFSVAKNAAPLNANCSEANKDHPFLTTYPTLLDGVVDILA